MLMVGDKSRFVLRGGKRRKCFVFALCSMCIAANVFAQSDDGLVAEFTFNNGTPANNAGGAPANAVGVTYVDDRFGNPRSACFIHGAVGSYLNLGTGYVLKPPQGSVSMWVKMMGEIYSGRGYECNPIILTKNAQGDDFFEAYAIAYGLSSKRISIASSLSSLNQVAAVSSEPFELYEWHHLVLTYSDSALCLYVDGEAESVVAKHFRTKFLFGDSVMVGYSANIKNQRYFLGCVDDIAIYNRVLSADDVAGLYSEGDPNRYRNLVMVLLASLVLTTVMVAIVARKFRKALEKEKEKNRIQRRVFEMETRVIKAQMNPHFIFNSMNSIQQFILADDTANANTYLVKFAKLLRKILESSTDDFISLDNEVDILHKYIEIESLRFDHAFSYEIVVDERLRKPNVRIPHMLVQPFVENAIWHGLLKQESRKDLKVIFSYVDEESLSCTIDDNGAGRATKKAAENRLVAKKKSLGIHFTSQRLELMRKEWGGKFGVEITDKVSEQGTSAGTRVSVTIPILNN